MIQSLRKRLDELEGPDEPANSGQRNQQQSQQAQQQTHHDDLGDSHHPQSPQTTRDTVAGVPEAPPPVDHDEGTHDSGPQAAVHEDGLASSSQYPAVGNDPGQEVDSWFQNDGGLNNPPATSPHNVSDALVGSAGPPSTYAPVNGLGRLGSHVASGAAPYNNMTTSASGIHAGSPQSQSSRSVSSRCIEPQSVERLMRPYDGAISQASATPPIPPGLKTLSAVAGAVSAVPRKCTCHRFLRTSQWTLPLRRQADDLVRLFFARVHRTYPILHQPTFMKQYRKLWEPAPSDTELLPFASNCSGLCRQKGLDRTFPAVVNVVFALASLFAPNPPEQNSARAEGFFNVTQQIDLLEVIDEEGGLDLVQLLLLMGFYLQSTERFSKCWNITGLAIRSAQNMGLQLSPHDARRQGYLTSCPTQREAEMRVRVWYGCVLLDREISTLFGRASMIRGDQLRLRLPEAIDDEYLSEEIATRNSQPADRPSALELFIQTIKLYAILDQIWDQDREAPKSVAGTPRHDSLPYSMADVQPLLDLDTTIMDWRDSLPPHLQHDATADEGLPDNALTPESLPPTDFAGSAMRLYVR